MIHLQRIDDVMDRYDVLLCDVWGVLHNGVASFAPANAALQRAREAGLTVVLITNAPRRFDSVAAQIHALGVPEAAYDRIVTSGDVTRELIRKAPRQLFHLGPDRDLTLYDGLDVELVEEREANGVVCTGFYDDETETPEDYAEMLTRFRSRDLPFICANPDIVVERGDRLIWCAGALARDYGQLGGRTLIAGKPHRPIYEAAIAAAGEARGAAVAHDRVLAIGDGMLTDVKGADLFGLDVLYISGGIHAGDYVMGGVHDVEKLTAFLEKHGSNPVATMPGLA
ncbi:TIGR01459 family HAD-type hydrolase [Phyllobacterium sp. 21LDTY02-6]|uniref:TIGR01459 family HAD-type hydrolase n=1 Tax=unclassified Phyllobacterium TaxID=2638441 RepID=UPI0020214A90|nr:MULTISPECIES: TIGR01459 family HAD-type hydrolase [unclassified Phyllobacterium]MCO4318671.1 TIGR01459 family HAD-type hydrolase [Phyllobacterium sp. 21LDTY02-6]MCX8281186.1 TIGR01459 family HAD-type hydrolase [Phyllobacterium sp. 0TCS1.6C]MCX8294527.1 TIGR01459 family HAD-type hydrolase [Phyllobacterium sp. 0TCS1.6A]